MFRRHVWVRLRLVATDPGAMIVLVVAGIATVPLWGWRWALVRGWDRNQPWIMTGLLCCAALVAAASSRGVFQGRSAWAVLPALPLGVRARIAAETVVAIFVVLVVRTLLFAFGLTPWSAHRSPSYVFHLWVGTTLWGVLVTTPTVLAWMAVPRSRPRFLVPPVLVSMAVYAAARGGWMADLRVAAVFSVTLSVLALASAGLDLVPRMTLPEILRRRESDWRPSPGPTIQFGRECWLGVWRELWPLLAVVVPLPWVARAVAGQLYADPFVARTAFGLLAVLQLLALLVVVVHPFGQRVSGDGSPSAGRGYFVRAWSVLPVPPDRVVRAVYGHAWISAALLWGLLCVHFPLPRLAVFASSFVPLIAAVVLCEAVGDRGRGRLALAAFLAIQLLPIFLWQVLGPSPGMPWWGFATAYLMAAAGSLPPLTHLRSHGAAWN